jgi:hypothetical protein
MSSMRELMKECADTHIENGDKVAGEAILVAIDDIREAKRKFPQKVTAIDNALNYARNESRF